MSKLIREIRFIRMSKRMLNMVKSINASSSNLLTDDIERVVDQFPDNLAFLSSQGNWTYAQFDAYANRIAHWAEAKGLQCGDSVAIFSQNRLEYVALWYGLSKIGVVAALLNYQLRGRALAHCVNVAACQFAIIDDQLKSLWNSAKPHIDHPIETVFAFGPKAGPNTLDAQLKDRPDTRPDRRVRAGMRAKDELMKMFTSGTTGMPKAAKIAHTKGQLFMRGFTLPAGTGANDRMMMVLPLYHATGGMCGVGAVLMKGGAVIVLEKFSVSSFWDDAIKYDATHFTYVGELCRFLLNAAPHPNDRAHHIHCIVGNGLRPEIWRQFMDRFGVENVVEFYGATEGNISLINYDGKVGAVGRIPRYLRHKMNGTIVRYSVEDGTYPKGPDGLMIRTEPGEIGELIGEIKPSEARFRFDGYQNESASEKKVLHNVFTMGDMWFKTGDLFWCDKDGHYFFTDRLGDTYRWKAENVSTNEVAGVISQCEGVEQANVYGVNVPGYDGKAGMASLVCSDVFDLEVLHSRLHKALPSYARPLFVRLSKETDTTTTFKYVKTDLVKTGFDPKKIKDPVYIDHPEKRKYIQLNAKIFNQIKNEDIRF